jgi:hypothetical protein
MKNTFLKTIGTMLAILMLAMFAQISASAQDKNNKEESNVRTEENLSAQRENNDRKLEGSWNIQVTRRNCQTGEALVTFPTMTTFMSGGTMQDYGVALAPTGRGPGHGVWSHQSGLSYSAAFQFFLFGGDGISTGRQIIRRQIELNRSGNAYAAVGAVEVLTTGGAVIANICTTETGTRFE